MQYSESTLARFNDRLGHINAICGQNSEIQC